MNDIIRERADIQGREWYVDHRDKDGCIHQRFFAWHEDEELGAHCEAVGGLAVGLMNDPDEFGPWFNPDGTISDEYGLRQDDRAPAAALTGADSGGQDANVLK